MPASNDTGVQPVGKGFQCCSCCGQPGRKVTTCSCKKLEGNTHQCRKQLGETAKKQLNKVIRKWVFIVFSMLTQPEKIDLDSQDACV
jgi:hypothetical protein